MKAHKIIKLLFLILSEGIIILSAGLIGMHNERTRILQEEEADTVTDIAVVNLDEGILENGKVRYYANELMDLQPDYLVPESIEAARSGIDNGSYAAYILIPSDFSRNAVSINTVPEKSRLVFAINPNLREDISRLTMSDIKNFEINLNTNMSYMYMQAILEEFHTVQDSAGIIMENDSAEMARLQNVEPGSLMESLQPMETDPIETDIEEVDFRNIFEANSQISQELRNSYDSFARQGLEAFGEVKSKEETVIEGMGDFFDVVAEIDISTNAAGEEVYKEGITSLSKYLKEYEIEFLKKRNTVYKKIDAMTYITPIPDDDPEEEPGEGSEEEPGEGSEEEPGEGSEEEPGEGSEEEPGEGSEEEPGGGSEGDSGDGSDEGDGENPGEEPDEPPVEPIPQIIAKIIQTSLDTANQKIETKNVQNQEKIDTAKEKINSIRQVIATDIEVSEEDLPLKEQLDIIEIYLAELELEMDGLEPFEKVAIEEIYDADIVKKEFQELADMIQELPQVEIQEYEGIFEEEILNPLEEEIQQENARVQEEGNKYLGVVEAYTEELGEFDPYEYYDDDKMAKLESSFAENIFELEDKTYKLQSEYLEFVYDSVDTSNESMEQMKENLMEAYEVTEENVTKEVDLAKQYRQEMNGTNIEILGDFVTKLPYTRIGNLEYVQAYDYMVKPIVMSDISVHRDRVLILRDYDALKRILIVMAGVWCLFAFSITGIKMYRSFQENAKEE